MIRRFLPSLLCLPLLATLAVMPASAATEEAAPAPVFTSAQRAAIEGIVKQFIADNPEALISSVETHYNKQAASKEKQEGRVETPPAGLYDDARTPVMGNKDAAQTSTIVEFFDYNCGYCKQVATDLERLVNEEKAEVKFLFKELPILAESSETAARYALAADKQGKYMAYHQALMLHQGPITDEFLVSAAKDVGLDVEKLKKDSESQDIRDHLQKNVELARALGVRGTPFFVIGKEKVPGAIGYTQMKETLYRERGLAAIPASPAAAAPSADTGTSATGTTGSAPSAAPSAAPVAPAGNLDPEVKAEMDKARAETNAMLEEIKKQAEDLKRRAVEAGAAAKEQAKEEPAKKPAAKQ